MDFTDTNIKDKTLELAQAIHGPQRDKGQIDLNAKSATSQNSSKDAQSPDAKSDPVKSYAQKKRSTKPVTKADPVSVVKARNEQLKIEETEKEKAERDRQANKEQFKDGKARAKIGRREGFWTCGWAT